MPCFPTLDNQVISNDIYHYMKVIPLDNVVITYDIFVSELCEREKDAHQKLCWNIFVNELYMWTKKECGW